MDTPAVELDIRARCRVPRASADRHRKSRNLTARKLPVANDCSRCEADAGDEKSNSSKGHEADLRDGRLTTY